jgi:hypothetical protein
MLIFQELETRILNINYLLKRPDVTEAQKGQLFQLLGNAESELLEVYESGSLWEASPRPTGSSTYNE